MEGIRLVTQCKLAFGMHLLEDTASRRAARVAKSYKNWQTCKKMLVFKANLTGKGTEIQLKSVTYSVYWRRPSPVESKNRTKWRQHISLTLSMPLSLKRERKIEVLASLIRKFDSPRTELIKIQSKELISTTCKFKEARFLQKLFQRGCSLHFWKLLRRLPHKVGKVTWRDIALAWAN